MQDFEYFNDLNKVSIQITKLMETFKQLNYQKNSIKRNCIMKYAITDQQFEDLFTDASLSKLKEFQKNAVLQWNPFKIAENRSDEEDDIINQSLSQHESNLKAKSPSSQETATSNMTPSSTPKQPMPPPTQQKTKRQKVQQNN